MDLNLPDDVVGIEALRRIHAEGPKRHQLGLVLDGDSSDPLSFHWEDITVGGQKVGDMTNCIWSPRMQKNIGYALISKKCNIGDTVVLARSNQRKVNAQLVDLPFY